MGRGGRPQRVPVELTNSKELTQMRVTPQNQDLTGNLLSTRYFHPKNIIGNRVDTDKLEEAFHQEQRKTQPKITDDSCLSINVLRVGNADKEDGPIIIIFKGKCKKNDSIFLNNLVKVFGCPPGSCVINITSVYMTNEAWI